MLVEERTATSCAYTLKIYKRLPQDTEGGERGGRVILRSENHDQPDIEFNEEGESQDQRFFVIAEFVQVLDSLDWIRPASEIWKPYPE